MPTETAEQKAPMYTDEHPEFPKLVYNHETRKTKVASDKKNEEDLAKQGYVEQPYPDVDTLSHEEIATLQEWLTKATGILVVLDKLKHELTGLHDKTSGKPAAKPAAAPTAVPAAAPTAAKK